MEVQKLTYFIDIFIDIQEYISYARLVKLTI